MAQPLPDSGPVTTSRLHLLTNPPHLWTRNEVLTTKCVPRSAGVYAWFFREVPGLVPVEGCFVKDGATLLYGGIAPKAPPKNGKPASSQTLFHRLRYHMHGNAYGSTLRLTLGCLLAEKLGIQLRRVGSGTRRTFAIGEAKLSAWMEENAAVCWMETSQPWVIEADFIAATSLPLNLDQNHNHPFYASLTALRATAKRRADELPVWRDF
jgi:hypothetical protein